MLSHKIGVKKPHKKIYATCIKQMKVNKKDVTMVGNNLEKYVLRPVELGMDGILFDPGNRFKYKNRITSFKELL